MMDPIFNHESVKMSKDEFRDTYDYVVGTNTAIDVDHSHDLAARNNDVTLHDSYQLLSEYNQLVLTVKNTAFSLDHIVTK